MSPEAAPATFRRTQLRVAEDSAATQVRERGRVEGYAAGWTEGAKAAAAAGELERARQQAQFVAAEAEREQRVQAAVSVLAHAAHALTARTAPVIAAAEQATLEAILEIAASAVGVELSDGARSARAALAKALNGSTPVGTHTVQLSPQDLARVRLVLTDAGGLPEGVELVADPALSNGDAVVQFPDGYLDARTRTALERARTALLGAST